MALSEPGSGRAVCLLRGRRRLEGMLSLTFSWEVWVGGGEGLQEAGGDDVVISIMVRSGPKKWLLVKKDLWRDERFCC